MSDMKAELNDIESAIDTILKGNFTKNEIHGRLLEVWGKVRRLNGSIAETSVPAETRAFGGTAGTDGKPIYHLTVRP